MSPNCITASRRPTCGRPTDGRIGFCVISRLCRQRFSHYGRAVFDVRRLAVFEEVVRGGSLTAAAAAMSYTTSAVSQQITALERELGSVLLTRGPNGTVPTAAGLKLLEHSALIRAAIDAAQTDLERLATVGPAVLRIASFSSAAAAILPKAVARFRTARPQTELRLLPADPDEAVTLLGTEGADVAVITEVPGDKPEFASVWTVPVFDDEFFVVLPRGHRLSALREVPLAALAADEWIVSSATGTCPDTRVFRKVCRQAEFEPTVSFLAEDYSTVQGMVAANLGVSMVPSLAAGSVRNDVVVRRVQGHRPVRRISLATTAAPQSGTPLAVLVSLICSVGARLAADEVFSVPSRSFNVA